MVASFLQVLGSQVHFYPFKRVAYQFCSWALSLVQLALGCFLRAQQDEIEEMDRQESIETWNHLPNQNLWSNHKLIKFIFSIEVLVSSLCYFNLCNQRSHLHLSGIENCQLTCFWKISQNSPKIFISFSGKKQSKQHQIMGNFNILLYQQLSHLYFFHLFVFD